MKAQLSPSAVVQLENILTGYQSLRDLWNAYHELADCLADRPWMQPEAASVLLHAMNTQLEERISELETLCLTLWDTKCCEAERGWGEGRNERRRLG